MKRQLIYCFLAIMGLVVMNGIGEAQVDDPNAVPTEHASLGMDPASRNALASRWQKKQDELARKLLEPIDVAFFETPLQDVVFYLADKTGIEILIDDPALDTLGLDRSIPITLKLHDVPLRTALDVILGEHELTFVTKDGVLSVTSQEEAENQLVTRVYNVQSLLRPDQPLESLEAIVALVTSTVEPDSWAEFGGPGTIETYQMALVIRQTERTHERLENVLYELDQVVTAAGGPSLPIRDKAPGGGGG